MFRWLNKFTIFFLILLNFWPCHLRSQDIYAPPFWQKKIETYGTYSNFQERVLNRKNVYQMVVERFNEQYSLTLLVHHPKPWNFKSKAHPLYILFTDIQKLTELMKYLDAYLESGYNFKIRLDGSRITQIYFFQTQKNWNLN